VIRVIIERRSPQDHSTHGLNRSIICETRATRNSIASLGAGE
jgi:hypothetical protein